MLGFIQAYVKAMSAGVVDSNMQLQNMNEKMKRRLLQTKTNTRAQKDPSRKSFQPKQQKQTKTNTRAQKDPSRKSFQPKQQKRRKTSQVGRSNTYVRTPCMQST